MQRETAQVEETGPSAAVDHQEVARDARTVGAEEILSGAQGRVSPSSRTLIPEVDHRPTLRAR